MLRPSKCKSWNEQNHYSSEEDDTKKGEEKCTKIILKPKCEAESHDIKNIHEIK